jgi:hypothetical protein
MEKNNDFEINLRITGEGLEIVDKKKDGTVTYKPCHVSEFIKLLELSTEKAETYTVRSDRLPKNCIENLNFINEKKIDHGYFIVMESGEYSFHYYETEYKIHLPNLLMYFKVVGERVANTYVYVVLESMDKINNDTQIYVYPFGNCASEGSVCWGNNALPPIKKPSHLNGLPYLFITSPTVDHSFDGKTTFEGSQRELLEVLQKKEINFEEILKPYKTYGELVEGFQNRYW